MEAMDETRAALAAAQARIAELEAANRELKAALAAATGGSRAPAAGAPNPAAPTHPAAPPAALGLGELLHRVGELSFSSPRGKMEVAVHAGGVQLKAKAFTLSIPTAALQRCVQLDLGNRNGLTCLLQLDAPAVQSEGQVPKGGKEFCAFTRKPTDPDLRAALAAAGLGPEWVTSTPFKADTGRPFVPAYVKAAEVQIVPLETHLLVLGKPTLCVAYEQADISIPEAVNGRKTFDMGLAFAVPDGSGTGGCELSMVPTQAHAALFDFLRRSKKAGAAAGKRAAQAAQRAGASPARSGAGGEAEGEEEGEEEGGGSDESDEEEEDDDFRPGDDSEPEEEFDSDGGEPMPEPGAAGSGSEEDDDDELGTAAKAGQAEVEADAAGVGGGRDQSGGEGDDDAVDEPAAKVMRTA